MVEGFAAAYHWTVDYTLSLTPSQTKALAQGSERRMARLEAQARANGGR